jgi:hypothetical protein
MSPAVLEVYAAEFDRCAPLIERALEYTEGCYDLGDVRNAVLSGRMQLWPGDRSAMVTELVHYPSRKGLIVTFAGGEFAELDRMKEKVRAFAVENGCDFWATHGRPGWARKLGIGRVVSTVCMEDI